MPRLPTFENATDDEKLEFLYDWCDNLNTSLLEAKGNIQLLHERLRKVENQGSADPQKT